MASETADFSGNTGEHVLGVGERFLVNLYAANHTRDFRNALAAGQWTCVDMRDAALGLFGDLYVMLPLRGDLCEVGDAKRLTLFAKRAQFTADDLRHASTDADVDFIEDERRDV